MKNTYLFYGNRLVDDLIQEEIEQFRCEDKRFRFIYKTTLPNGLYYIGQHKTKPFTKSIVDGYRGSGMEVKHFINVNGSKGIRVDIMSFAHSAEELSMMERAYIGDLYCKDLKCLNCQMGGQLTTNGWSPVIFYDYNGVDKTIHELANMAGISIAAMRYRIKHSKTANEAVNKHYYKKRVFEIGEEKLTLSEYGRMVGIQESTFRSRIKRGYSVDEALSMPLREFSKEITYNGITDTMRGWERRIGIERHFVRTMLRKGFCIEEIFKHYEIMKNMKRNERISYSRKYLKRTS